MRTTSAACASVAFIASTLFSCCFTTAQAAESKPNIVFILADDLGWTDLGCQGSKYYETPNLDRMAAEGMRFTNGYTCAANCAPTRAALMSGQYGPRTGVYTVGGTNRFDTTMRPLVPVENLQNLALEKITVAEALKQGGYQTAMFGKWHLGNNEFHPSHQGFDEAVVSAGKHFNFSTQPKVAVGPEVYLADFLTDRAVDFIERKKDQPFFLYVPHFGVHSPYEAKEEWIARFKDKPGVGGHRNPVYAAMIASVDESVGRILRKIDELGLGEKTLVIFSSDNGGVGGYERLGIARDTTDNTPLRGGKGMFYEGGVRVPYVFRWTGKVAAGKVCDEPINSVDLYPTLLDVTGAARPEGYTLDGASYLPCLLSDGTAQLDRDVLFWHMPGYLGSGPNIWRTTPVTTVRARDYKLMQFLEDGHLELYNLKEDIGETQNLVDLKPQVAKELYEKLDAWRTAIGAPMPEKRTNIAPWPNP
ncbi:MAG: sulfatase, partial [Planctomycetota bacterium]